MNKNLIIVVAVLLVLFGGYFGYLNFGSIASDYGLTMGKCLSKAEFKMKFGNYQFCQCQPIGAVSNYGGLTMAQLFCQKSTDTSEISFSDSRLSDEQVITLAEVLEEKQQDSSLNLWQRFVNWILSFFQLGSVFLPDPVTTIQAYSDARVGDVVVLNPETGETNYVEGVTEHFSNYIFPFFQSYDTPVTIGNPSVPQSYVPNYKQPLYWCYSKNANDCYSQVTSCGLFSKTFDSLEGCRTSEVKNFWQQYGTLILLIPIGFIVLYFIKKYI